LRIIRSFLQGADLIQRQTAEFYARFDTGKGPPEYSAATIGALRTRGADGES